ncbi:hypothetical protein ERJ75_001508400 [Trypanosoma vivax]|nr:hypothetical protein ERJ75_001508400 [Trypanosoma vivax]
MEGAGVIFEASRKPAEGFVVSFAVVEGKAAGLRRRFIALPKGKNDHGDCEAEAPLQHASCYLHAVFGELATVFDMKASFFQVSLPRGNRTSFRCRTEAGRLVELTRLKMGCKCGPQMLHAGIGRRPRDCEFEMCRTTVTKNTRLDRQYSNLRAAAQRREAEPCCNPECEAVRRHAG